MKILDNYKGLPREIYIIFISRVITSIGAFVTPLLTFILTDKIGLSGGESGKFIAIIALAQGPSIILGGKLADKIGRKRTLVIFQSIGIIMYFICGIMEHSINLVYCIILASAAFSAAVPSLDALNADLTNEKNRKVAYSLIYMGFNLGFAIGPVIGGALYKNHLNLIFIGDALTTLASLILIIKFIKEPKRKENIKINGKFEGKEEESVINVILKRPALIIFALSMLTFQFGYSQWGFILPIQLKNIFEDGAFVNGILGGLNGILVVILTPILTNLMIKYKSVKVMAIGGIFYASSFLMLGSAMNIWMFVACAVVLTIGEILIATNAQAFIANRTPASHRGRVSGVIPLIYGIGYSIGPWIMGGIVDEIGIMYSWSVVAIIVLIGSTCMYSILKIKNKVENEIYEEGVV